MSQAKFLTELHAEVIASGNQTDWYQLTEPFKVWSDVLQNIIEVPGGFEFDGESAPWPLKRFGFSRRAACVHDWLYFNGGYFPPVTVTGSSELIRVTREQADKVYLELCLLAGLPSWRAHLRYAGLRAFGWKAWNHHRDND